MKANPLLTAIAVSLIGATPSSAQSSTAESSYSRSFGYPSYAGAPFSPPAFGAPASGDRRGRITAHTQSRRGRDRK